MITVGCLNCTNFSEYAGRPECKLKYLTGYEDNYMFIGDWKPLDCEYEGGEDD